MSASIEMRNKATAGLMLVTTGTLGGLAVAEGIPSTETHRPIDNATHELQQSNDLDVRYQLASQRIKEMALAQNTSYRSLDPGAHYSTSTKKSPAEARIDKYRYPNRHGHPCGGNRYSHYIYFKESTCRVKAVNGGGCKGLGQACPGSKLIKVCRGLTYKCEDRFFKNYARSRYGGWKGAYNFWTSHGWW